jgi:hypothetical protein
MPNFVLLKMKCYTQKVIGFAYTAKAEQHTPNLPFDFMSVAVRKVSMASPSANVIISQRSLPKCSSS